jgi:hypothetical protein
MLRDFTAGVPTGLRSAPRLELTGRITPGQGRNQKRQATDNEFRSLTPLDERSLVEPEPHHMPGFLCAKLDHDQRPGRIIQGFHIRRPNKHPRQCARLIHKGTSARAASNSDTPSAKLHAGTRRTAARALTGATTAALPNSSTNTPRNRRRILSKAPRSICWTACALMPSTPATSR